MYFQKERGTFDMHGKRYGNNAEFH